ncbi:MAG: hypothetical protein FWD63_01585 [Propionibacteriaceae bacterium]|nr:hypothetical protein [Propionibacteriaceae bacterium]
MSTDRMIRAAGLRHHWPDAPGTRHHGQPRRVGARFGQAGVQQRSLTGYEGAQIVKVDLKIRLPGLLVMVLAVVTVSGCIGTVVPPPSVSPSPSATSPSAPEASLRWAKTMGGNGFDVFNSVALAPNGDIIAVGWTTSTDGDFPAKIYPQGGNAVVTRLSPDGTKLWARTYGGNNGSSFASVVVSADGSIFAVGQASPKGDFNCDFGGAAMGQAAVKLDADGKIAWSRCFTASSFGVYDFVSLSSVAVASDGIYLAGKTVVSLSPGPSGSMNAGLVVKLDLDGNLVWFRIYDADAQDSFAAVTVDQQSDVIVAGATAPGNGPMDDQGNPDGLVVVYDSSGHQAWARTYGGSGLDGFTALTLGSDKKIVVAGFTTSEDGDFSTQPDGTGIGGVIAGLAMDGSLDWSTICTDSQFTSIHSAADNHFVATGITWVSNGASPDPGSGSLPFDQSALVLKVTSSGVVEWSANLITTPVYFASVAVTADGAATVVGTTSLTTGAMACPADNSRSCAVVATFYR